MDFKNLINKRYSARKYDKNRAVEDEKIDAILDSAILSPSACNGQPYHITVCRGELALKVAHTTQSMGMNSFASDAPVMLVISEMPYCKRAAAGAKLKHNDYRSIDIGILASYITAMATELGLGTCIIGWFDNKKLREICALEYDVRLVISLGYALDEPREKKRKLKSELVSFME